MGDLVAFQVTKATQNGAEVWFVLCFPGAAFEGLWLNVGKHFKD